MYMYLGILEWVLFMAFISRCSIYIVCSHICMYIAYCILYVYACMNLYTGIVHAYHMDNMWVWLIVSYCLHGRYNELIKDGPSALAAAVLEEVTTLHYIYYMMYMISSTECIYTILCCRFPTRCYCICSRINSARTLKSALLKLNKIIYVVHCSIYCSVLYIPVVLFILI